MMKSNFVLPTTILVFGYLSSGGVDLLEAGHGAQGPRVRLLGQHRFGPGRLRVSIQQDSPPSLEP